MKLASTDLQIGQAQSLISIQAECGRSEAMLLLRKRAAECNQPLVDVARDIMAHRIRFDPPAR
jgi:AmiR/NasT family two-component response regulator